MQFAQVYKFLAILVLLGTKGADGLFSAYVPENVHNIAQLSVAVHDELLHNGLYAEIVGEVADRKEACGIVMLDYTAYVHGDLFEATIKPIEDYLLATSKRTVLNETLRMEVYKAMKALALAAHKADMRDLFAKRQASTSLHRPTKLKSFPNAGVVAFDIGMSLFGGFILESVEDSVEESDIRNYKMSAIGNAFVALINGMTLEVSRIHFGSAFALICFPMTAASDVHYLIRVEPLGQFLPNMSSYWMHDVGGLYAIGKTENRSINLATLRMVEHESLCRHSSSVLLCNLQEQVTGCGLLSADRHYCQLVLHNSSDEYFTLVRPLARSVIVATRATRMYEVPSKFDEPRARVVTNPVFAVEVPRGKWLVVGGQVIYSSGFQGMMGAQFKVIVPDSTPDYSPNAMPYMGSDFWIWLYSDAPTLLPLLFSLFAAVFGATIIWKQFTSIRAMKKDYEEMMQWKDYYERHLMPKYPSIPNMYD